MSKNDIPAYGLADKCPHCHARGLSDLVKHCNKLHKRLVWSETDASKIGALACVCGALVRNQLGLGQHKRRYCKLVGPSKVNQASGAKQTDTLVLATTNLSSNDPARTLDSIGNDKSDTSNPSQILTLDGHQSPSNSSQLSGNEWRDFSVCQKDTTTRGLEDEQNYGNYGSTDLLNDKAATNYYKAIDGTFLVISASPTGRLGAFRTLLAPAAPDLPDPDPPDPDPPALDPPDPDHPDPDPPDPPTTQSALLSGAHRPSVRRSTLTDWIQGRPRTLATTASNQLSHTPPDQDVDEESSRDPLVRRVNFEAVSSEALIKLWNLLPEPRNDLAAPVQECFLQMLDTLCKQYVDPAVPKKGSILRHILCLPKFGLSRVKAHGHVSKTREQLRDVAHLDTILVSLPAKRTSATLSRVARAEAFMSQGYLSRASKALFEDNKSVNPSEPGVLQELRTLQCPPDRLPFPESRGLVQPEPITVEVLRACVNSMKLDSAGGPSGWPVFLLRSAMHLESFVEFLLMLVNEIVQGEAPLRELLCASRLVPLRKPNGKLRPIAVGELFYRLAGKAVVRTQRRSGDLRPQQLGVGTPGGTEPIIAMLRDRLSAPDSNWACIQLDLSNAFNAISRYAVASAVQRLNPALCRFMKWAYSQPSWLSIGGAESLLKSEQGVRQGDPMGSYLFSLGLHPLLAKMESQLTSIKDSWAYFDDIVVWCERNQLDAAVSDIKAFFTAEGARVGLQLNPDKIEIITPERLRDSGADVLGTAIGTHAYRRSYLRKKLNDLNTSLETIRGVSKQSALLLLRQSLLPSVAHLLRNLEADDLVDDWQRADALILDEVRRLVNAEVDSPYDLKTMRTLPMKLGGLGLPSFGAVRQHAFIAANSAATHYYKTIDGTHPVTAASPTGRPGGLHTLLAPAGPDPPDPDPPDPDPPTQKERCAVMWKELAEEFRANLLPKHRELFRDNQSQISYAWMLAFPLRTAPALKLSNKEVSVALIARTLNSGFAGACACGRPAAPSHDLSCPRKSSYRTARHESIKRLFATIYRNLNCTVRSEPLTDIGASRDRADLSVRGPAALGDYSVIDFSVVSPLSVDNFPIARLLEDRHKQKIAQYKDQFRGSEFVPFVLTVGGTLHPTASKVMAKIVDRGYSAIGLKMEMSVALLRARSEHWNRY